MNYEFKKNRLFGRFTHISSSINDKKELYQSKLVF